MGVSFFVCSAAVPAGMHVAQEGEWAEANPDLRAGVQAMQKNNVGAVVMVSKEMRFNDAIVALIGTSPMNVAPTANPVDICKAVARKLVGKDGETPKLISTPLGVGCETRSLKRGVSIRVALLVDRERQTAVVLMVLGRTRTADAVAAIMGDLRWH